MTARKAVERQTLVRAFDRYIMFLDLDAVINNAFDLIQSELGSDHLSITVLKKDEKDFQQERGLRSLGFRWGASAFDQ